MCGILIYKEVIRLSIEDGLRFVSLIVRLLAAMISGGVIGVERGKSNQSAGMRTYMLVCVGSAIVMITGEYLYYHYNTGDPARLGAQVISGIGFLGAGSIVVSGKSRIRGLTTAAGLWTSACIGLVYGTGFLECGMIATIIVYVIIAKLRRFEERVVSEKRWIEIIVKMDDISVLGDIYCVATNHVLRVGNVQIFDKKNDIKSAIIALQNMKEIERHDFLCDIENTTSVKSIKYIS